MRWNLRRYEALVERPWRGGFDGVARARSYFNNTAVALAICLTAKGVVRICAVCSAIPSNSPTAQITADEAYIRESILNPRAKTVAGFEQLMPTFQGQINEEGLLQLIAYITLALEARKRRNHIQADSAGILEQVAGTERPSPMSTPLMQPPAAAPARKLSQRGTHGRHRGF